MDYFMDVKHWHPYPLGTLPLFSADVRPYPAFPLFPFNKFYYHEKINLQWLGPILSHIPSVLGANRDEKFIGSTLFAFLQTLVPSREAKRHLTTFLPHCL